MQDATVFESATQKPLVSIANQGQCFPIHTNIRAMSSKSDQTADFVESKPMNGNEHNSGSEDVKRAASAAVHMVGTEAAVNIGNPVLNTSQQTGQMLWSVPSPNVTADCSNGEYTQNQSISSLNNNNCTVTFQQYSPVVASVNSISSIQPSSVLGSTMGFSNQASASLISHQGRSGGRAITGHNSVINFPRQQPNMMVNSSNPKVLTNWNNSPQTSWGSQQTQQASIYPQWNVQQQRRSVPNMSILAPVAAKKQVIQQQLQQQSPYSASSKFRRSTSFPGQMQQLQSGTALRNPYDFSTFDDMTFQVRIGLINSFLFVIPLLS